MRNFTLTEDSQVLSGQYLLFFDRPVVAKILGSSWRSPVGLESKLIHFDIPVGQESKGPLHCKPL